MTERAETPPACAYIEHHIRIPPLRVAHKCGYELSPDIGWIFLVSLFIFPKFNHKTIAALIPPYITSSVSVAARWLKRNAVQRHSNIYILSNPQ